MADPNKATRAADDACAEMLAAGSGSGVRHELSESAVYLETALRIIGDHCTRLRARFRRSHSIDLRGKPVAVRAAVAIALIEIGHFDRDQLALEAGKAALHEVNEAVRFLLEGGE